MSLLINNNFNPIVLIVDDREAVLTMMSYNMRRHGFIVYTAVHLQRAENIAQKKTPHVIVLRDQLEGASTIGYCQWLRAEEATKTTPIVVLAEGANPDFSKLLEDGLVQDVIQMPAKPADLVERVRVIYRKHRPAAASKMRRILQFDDVVMDLASFKVTKDGRNVHLGPTEFKILQCLMEFPKRTLSREYIMTYVWGNKKSNIETRTIDVHINRLRTALREADNNNDPQAAKTPLIETIRSAGYCMRRESAAASILRPGLKSN